MYFCPHTQRSPKQHILGRTFRPQQKSVTLFSPILTHMPGKALGRKKQASGWLRFCLKGRSFGHQGDQLFQVIIEPKSSLPRMPGKKLQECFPTEHIHRQTHGRICWQVCNGLTANGALCAGCRDDRDKRHEDSCPHHGSRNILRGWHSGRDPSPCIHKFRKPETLQPSIPVIYIVAI